MFKVLTYPVSFLIYLLYAVSLSLLAIPFSWLPIEKKKSPDGLVDGVDTVCKSLWHKGIIPKSDYQFELEVVSAHYPYFVFWGYQVLVGPLLFLLKTTNHYDLIIGFFVKHWIKVQKALQLGQGKSNLFKKALAFFGIGLAAVVGKALVIVFGYSKTFKSYAEQSQEAE